MSRRALGCCFLTALAALHACGGTGGSGGPPDFDSGPGGAGGASTGGSGGSVATGGSGGSSASGGTGGSVATGGTGGSIATGGTGGSIATGGTGGSIASGGSGGSVATGGTGGAGVDAGSDASDASADAPADGGLDATDGGTTGPRLVMSEGTASRIYVLTTSGTVISNFASPVNSPRGVAYDRTKKDGFFVMGAADATKIYKMSFSGSPLPSVSMASALPNPSTMRGLDYYVNAGGDQLVFVYQNVNSIDVVQAVDLTGVTQLQSSHYKGGFLAGFWGIHVVGPASSDVERWTAWSDGSLQRWVGSQNQAQVLSTGQGALRGLTRTPAGTFWAVAGNQIIQLDATGAKISGFTAPSSDPRDLSWVE